MTQTPKPDKDEKKTHGNFTKIPNMLCEGAYNHLEYDEKWLYVCVKALCKGKGTRFLSLRYISKKTGFPLSSLSKKLPRLHDAGLIHCEFKKRIDEDGNEYGNTQYHVTIADKWEENDAFYGVTCSPEEHYEGEDSKPVHDMNEPVRVVNTSVHQMNEPVRLPERTCSPESTSKDNKDREDSKKRNEEEDITISARAENGMPALIHLEVEKKRRETDPHIPVIRVSSHSQRLSETSKEEEEETTRAAKGHVHESTASARAALPCVEHYLLAGDGESSQQEASATSEHITLQQPPDAGQVASAPAASTALGVSSPPPTSGVQQGAGYGHTPPKPRLKKTVIVKDTAGPPPFPSESEAWGTTTCLHLFDFWRGAPLCDLGQLKYASSCAKKLAETYTRKQVVIVRTAMNNQKFWKEQGGADVCDVARHMGKELNKLKMPVTAPAQQQSPDQSRPTLEEVECIDPTWCVYQRPGDTQEWILWQGELLTEDEANDRGYAGGGGLYIQTQYA